MTQPVSEEQGALACAAHPDVMTYLRCGKCGKPICPRCLVQTPVGARCRECAQLRKLPQYYVSPTQYLRAAGTSLGIGVAGGVVWAVMPFAGFFSFILSALLGYVVAAGVNRATNRRVDRWIQVIAALGVVTAFLISRGGPAWLVVVDRLAQGAMGQAGTVLILIVQNTFSNPFSLLGLAIGIYIAVRQVG